jgi:hypothetical protein
MKCWDGLGHKHPLIEELDALLGKLGYMRNESALKLSEFVMWRKLFFDDIDVCVQINQLPRPKGVLDFAASLILRSNSIKIWECGHPVFLIDQQPLLEPEYLFCASVHGFILRGHPPKMRTTWKSELEGARELALEFVDEFVHYVCPFIDSIDNYERLISFIENNDKPEQPAVHRISIGESSFLLAFLLSRVGKLAEAIKEVDTGARIALAEIERDWQGEQNAEKRSRRKAIVICKAERYLAFFESRLNINA